MVCITIGSSRNSEIMLLIESGRIQKFIHLTKAITISIYIQPLFHLFFRNYSTFAIVQNSINVVHRFSRVNNCIISRTVIKHFLLKVDQFSATHLIEVATAWKSSKRKRIAIINLCFACGAYFCRNNNNTVRGTNAINGGCRSIFQNGYGSNIIGINSC